MSWKKLLAGSAVVALLSLGIGVVVPPEVAAASITPYVPTPLNFLPSTVVGAVKGVQSTADARILLMLQMAKNATPEFWAALAAKQAGTASAAEVATVATQASRFAPIATKFVGLAGPAGVLVAGFTGGMAFGNSASRFLGFKDSEVCAENNGVLTAVSAATNGVDCFGWKNGLSPAQQNVDQAASDAFFTVGDKSCNAGGCGTITQLAPRLLYGQKVWCVQATALPGGGGPGGHPLVFQGSNTWGMDSYGPSSSYNNNMVGCTFDGLGGSYVMLYPNGSQVADSWSAGVGANRMASGSTRPNPDRKFQCTVTNTDGTTATMLSDTPWTEGNPVFGAVVQCPQPSPGVTPSTVDISENTGGTVKPLMPTQHTTPEWQASRTSFPECGSGECPLILRPSTGTQTCYDNPTLCAGWFTDPNKTSKYQCLFGIPSRVVSLDECTTLRPAFEPDSGVKGTTLADPVSGNTGVQTFANGDPSTGIDAPTGQCFPSGWSVFNPLEWVMKPVQCAIQWAFVPQPATVVSFQTQTTAAANGTAIGTLKTGLVGVFAAFAAGSTTCNGPAWAWNIDLPGGSLHKVEHPLSACTGTMASFAAIVRVAGAVFVWIFALLAIVRYVASIFGYIGFSTAKPEGGTTFVDSRTGEVL